MRELKIEKTLELSPCKYLLTPGFGFGFGFCLLNSIRHKYCFMSKVYRKEIYFNEYIYLNLKLVIKYVLEDP